MKKYIKYILLIYVSFSLPACSDFLDQTPDGELTLEMVFNDKMRTEDWLAGIYSKIPKVYWGYLDSEGYDTLSDDVSPSSGWAPFGEWGYILALRNGNWSTGSDWRANYWNELPRKIRSASIFINHVKPLPEQKLSSQEATLMKYEARFFIAYYYWLMAEAYGAIPFTPGVVYDTDASSSELQVGQTPFDDVISWIDKELIEVSKNLPASYSNNKYGRVTSVMCLAVRARMLLFAASPLVNGNPDYAGHVNDKGQELFNSTYSNQKWVYAAEACKELIDVAEKEGHALYVVKNNDGTIDPFLSCQMMMFTTPEHGNREALFARPGSDNIQGFESHASPRGAGGNGGLSVTQSLVDAFFMKDGKTIEDSPLYNETGFSTQKEVRNTKWKEVQDEGTVTLSNTYNMYCNREPRFYVSVLYNGAWYRPENRRTEFMSGQQDGGITHDAPETGYLLRKKVHPDFHPRNDQDKYRHGILYRLGEAYLNYAEALNEVDPSNPDIVEYLNRIRERAGIPTYGTAADQLPIPANQEAMRKAIYQERRVELNCEGIRYNDLRRWKLGVDILNKAFDGMNFYGKEYSYGGLDSYFKRVVYLDRPYHKKFYWFPVPQNEMDKNSKLVQNPFWNKSN